MKNENDGRWALLFPRDGIKHYDVWLVLAGFLWGLMALATAGLWYSGAEGPAKARPGWTAIVPIMSAILFVALSLPVLWRVIFGSLRMRERFFFAALVIALLECGIGFLAPPGLRLELAVAVTATLGMGIALLMPLAKQTNAARYVEGHAPSPLGKVAESTAVGLFGTLLIIGVVAIILTIASQIRWIDEHMIAILVALGVAFVAGLVLYHHTRLRRSTLMEAVQWGQEERIKELLQSGVDVNTRDDHGRTALHHAVDTIDEELVELLLRHNSDPNAPDKNGATPLHYAAKLDYYDEDEHAELIRLLIDAGADPQARDLEGKRPAERAKLQYVLPLLQAPEADTSGG
jgi:hypothetical protein